MKKYIFASLFILVPFVALAEPSTGTTFNGSTTTISVAPGSTINIIEPYTANEGLVVHSVAWSFDPTISTSTTCLIPTDLAGNGGGGVPFQFSITAPTTTGIYDFDVESYFDSVCDVPVSLVNSFPGIFDVVAATSTGTTTGTGSISGTVYNDLNRNGVLDTGEPVLSGWTINLYNHAGWSGPTNSAPIMSAVSDANGNYSFTGLAAGTYSIEEINQPTVLNQFTSDYSPVVLSAGQNLTGENFGNVKGNPYSTNPNPENGNKGYGNGDGNGNGNKGTGDKGSGNQGYGNQGNQGNQGSGNQGNNGNHFGQIKNGDNVNAGGNGNQGDKGGKGNSHE